MSPTSKRHNLLVKLDLYQRAKVKEYWVVSPEEKSVQMFLLDGGLLRSHEVYSPRGLLYRAQQSVCRGIKML